MEEEIEIRTRESYGQRSYSDQNMTYYYSKFELFEHSDEIEQFYLYSLFLEQVSNELGREWKMEANALASPYFNSRQIFMNLLSIWLHLHPLTNRVKQNTKLQHSIPVFNQSYSDQFGKRLKSSYNQKRKQSDPIDFVINSTAVKAICMGFFLSANQIWQNLFRNEAKVTATKPSWVLSSVSKTLQQSFKPLMVVTQKINHIFGRKRVKTDKVTQVSEKMDEQMFGDCYMEFKRTMDLQKKIQRKLSNFCLEDGNQKIEDKESYKTLTKDQFKEEDSPMEKNMLGSMYEYVTKFIRKRSPWQVASSFVTNILDIQQQKFDGTRIKVLRPAEDFYEKLLLAWITGVSGENNEMSYEEYLENVKISFGRSWRSKYLIPTRYFYERLSRHWTQIHKQVSNQTRDSQQILKKLIIKIRENMKQDWERKIKMQKREHRSTKSMDG